jgi:hypothetical protein
MVSDDFLVTKLTRDTRIRVEKAFAKLLQHSWAR